MMMLQSYSSLASFVEHQKSFPVSSIEQDRQQFLRYPDHISPCRTDQSCLRRSWFPSVSSESVSESFHNMIVVCVSALKSTEKVRREFLLTLAFTIKSFN